MAKHDDKRARTQITNQGTTAQNQINQTQGNLIPQNQQAQNYFTQAADRQMGDYGDIMQQYKTFAGQAPPATVSAQNVSYNRDPSVSSALSGFQNFANTGGYSDQDVTELRARGVSPIRSMYSNMMNEMTRNRSLQGGYSPNFNASANKMRAGTSQQIADQVTNVNAQLADAIRQGKLSGLEGLSRTGLADSQMMQQALLANQSAQLQAAGINSSSANAANAARLAAIEGQNKLFGTTPGLASTFGDQVTASNAALNEIPALQNQLGLGLIGGQIQAGQLPGDWEHNMGRIKDAAAMGGAIIGGL